MEPGDQTIGDPVEPCPSGITGSDVLPPTAEELEIARTPGHSAEYITARTKVIRYFYHGKEGLGDDRYFQDLKGIDLTQPVAVVTFPPPDTMKQYVRKGAKKPGNFFDPLGNQTGDSLGVNADPSIRESREFKTPSGQGLVTTAAPIKDDWTDPQHPVDAKGGGKQLVVDGPTRGQFVEVT